MPFENFYLVPVVLAILAMFISAKVPEEEVAEAGSKMMVLLAVFASLAAFLLAPGEDLKIVLPIFFMAPCAILNLTLDSKRGENALPTRWIFCILVIMVFAGAFAPTVPI